MTAADPRPSEPAPTALRELDAELSQTSWVADVSPTAVSPAASRHPVAWGDYCLVCLGLALGTGGYLLLT